MKKLLQLTLLLALTLPLGSCRKAVQKTASKIRLEAVERITPRGLSALEAVLRIDNGTSHRLTLERAVLTLHYQQSGVLTLTLHEGCSIEKHTTESIVTRWKMQFGDPLGLMLLAGAVRAGDASQISVSCQIGGRGGPARINLDRQMVPLSEFLRTFGVSMEDLNQYLPGL